MFLIYAFLNHRQVTLRYFYDPYRGDVLYTFYQSPTNLISEYFTCFLLLYEYGSCM